MNMSARPRTPVTYVVPRLRPHWVAFSWGTSRPGLNPEAAAILDAQWRDLGFTGAAVVHPLTDDLVDQVHPRSCDDRWLTLNVLLRVRGSLLLGEMPLLDDGDAVVNRGVTTDDPRLVAFAIGGSS